MSWVVKAVASTLAFAVAAAALSGGSAAAQREGRAQSPSVHEPLTFFVADGDHRSGYQPSDSELATWAFRAWARQSTGGITLQPSSEREAIVRLYWTPPDDGVFGEMRPLVVDGREGAAVYVRADIDRLDPELAVRARQDAVWRDTIVYLTCLHEIGHALGLRHTADSRDIMYFFGYGGDIVEFFARYRRQLASREDIPSASGLSSADVQRLRALHPVR